MSASTAPPIPLPTMMQSAEDSDDTPKMLAAFFQTRYLFVSERIALIYLWIGLGGALGSMARYWLSGVVADRFGESFPWGTMLVNISGSFIIGVFATLTDPDGRWGLVGPTARQFVMIGILGGYTTFSSFSIQTLNLARDGQWLWAGFNILGSVILCLAGVWAGHALAAAFNK
jgi:CrcB protein